MEGGKHPHRKQTFIPNDFILYFTRGKLVCDDYFLRPHFIQTHFDISPIQQRLVEARNIHNEEAPANLANISQTRIKVGLQYKKFQTSQFFLVHI